MLDVIPHFPQFHGGIKCRNGQLSRYQDYLISDCNLQNLISVLISWNQNMLIAFLSEFDFVEYDPRRLDLQMPPSWRPFWVTR